MQLEKTAKTLGYLGLIPFIAVGIALWIDRSYLLPQALIAYGACILSFLGGIHWGLALKSESDDAAQRAIVSNIPPLLGWAALLTWHTVAVAVLVIGFIGLLIYDLNGSAKSLLPDWFLKLRRNLTVVVCLVLVSSLFAS